VTTDPPHCDSTLPRPDTQASTPAKQLAPSPAGSHIGPIDSHYSVVRSNTSPTT
jgi:hypothetical protein